MKRVAWLIVLALLMSSTGIAAAQVRDSGSFDDDLADGSDRPARTVSVRFGGGLATSVTQNLADTGFFDDEFKVGNLALELAGYMSLNNRGRPARGPRTQFGILVGHYSFGSSSFWDGDASLSAWAFTTQFLLEFQRSGRAAGSPYLGLGSGLYLRKTEIDVNDYYYGYSYHDSETAKHLGFNIGAGYWGTMGRASSRQPARPGWGIDWKIHGIWDPDAQTLGFLDVYTCLTLQLGIETNLAR